MKELNRTDSQNIISTVKYPRFNPALEGLRAFAAIVVIIGHFVYHKRVVDPSFEPSGWISYQAPGHHAVLVFFVLSGYVIGLNHPVALKWSNVGEYLRKRFIRLYPIYVLALLAGFVVSGFAYSWEILGWHLIFGINGLPVATMLDNSPIWSLQYEVVFYLLFVPLSMMNVRPLIVAFVSAALAFICLMCDPEGLGQYTSRYLFGFSIWSTGWALAKITGGKGPVRYTQLVSALLLFLSLEVYNVLDTIGNRMLEFASKHPVGPLNIAQWKSQFLMPIDLMILPYAVLIVGQFLGFRGRVWKGYLIFLQLLPLYTFKYLLLNYQTVGAGRWTIPTVCYITSTLLFFWPSYSLVESLCRKLVKQLIPVGAISYGLYIIHFPIMVVFHRIHVFSGTLTTFVVRGVLVLTISGYAAYWLEKKFQPWAKRLLYPSRS